jgi:hypothetical protein
LENLQSAQEYMAKEPHLQGLLVLESEEFLSSK